MIRTNRFDRAGARRSPASSSGIRARAPMARRAPRRRRGSIPGSGRPPRVRSRIEALRPMRRGDDARRLRGRSRRAARSLPSRVAARPRRARRALGGRVSEHPPMRRASISRSVPQTVKRSTYPRGEAPRTRARETRTRRHRATPPPRCRQRRRESRADAAELAAVPGIGASNRRSASSTLREREGAFASLDELLDVAGMSESRLERARPYLEP